MDGDCSTALCRAVVSPCKENGLDFCKRLACLELSPLSATDLSLVKGLVVDPNEDCSEEPGAALRCVLRGLVKLIVGASNVGLFRGLFRRGHYPL
jgi:hypothetical protein